MLSSSSSRRRRPTPSSRHSQVLPTQQITNQRIKEQYQEMLHQRSPQDTGTTATTPFITRNASGEEFTSMDEYLQFASLSPWVPCPDPVAIRALDIAQVSPQDVHYELGCGDGRMNFHAIDTLYNVQKSVGIDIDPTLIERSNQRKARIYPTPHHLQFVCADLMDWKKDGSKTVDIWNDIQKECTVLTMYFVEDALLKLKPILEEKLVHSKCKVITIGYPIRGWEPAWVEVMLGLTIYMYDMSNADELYNRQNDKESVDPLVLQMDEELNVLSKQKIKAMEEEKLQQSLGGRGDGKRYPWDVGNVKRTWQDEYNPDEYEYDDDDEDIDADWDTDSVAESTRPGEGKS